MFKEIIQEFMKEYKNQMEEYARRLSLPLPEKIKLSIGDIRNSIKNTMEQIKESFRVY